MGGYSVFLAPIAGILASDYWIVNKQHIDVPALYNPDGRYHFRGGVNWCAFLAMCISVGPNLPGLAFSINPKGTHISNGAKNLFTFAWLFGFTTSIAVYVGLSLVFPSKATKIESTIYGNIVDEGSHSSDVESTGAGSKVGEKVLEPQESGHQIPTQGGEKNARSTAVNFGDGLSQEAL